MVSLQGGYFNQVAFGSEIQRLRILIAKTLHTGYHMVGGKDSPGSFCGVSHSLQNDPATIWAFMTPILKEFE